MITEGQRLEYAIALTAAAAARPEEDGAKAIAHLRVAAARSAQTLGGVIALLSNDHDQATIDEVDDIAASLQNAAEALGKMSIPPRPHSNRPTEVAYSDDPDLSCVARPQDIPQITSALNAELAREEHPHRLPETADLYTGAEITTLLETAVSEMLWHGSTITMCRWVTDQVPTAEHLAATEPSLRRFLHP